MTTITTRSGKGSPLTNDEVDANFTGLNSDKVETSGDSMTGDLSFGDNNKVILGSGNDLQLYHDGSNSYITDSGTGNLRISGTLLQLNDASFNKYLLGSGDSVTLYNADSAKLATTSTGIDVTGVITTDGMTTSADINFGDNDKAVFGAGSDLQIYHDASHSYIVDAGTGNMYLSTNGNGIVMQASLSETMFSALPNGSVRLYHDNSQKLETTSTGIDVTGSVTADSATIEGGLTVSSTFPTITFTDTDSNPDYQLRSANGYFQVYDSTNTAPRLLVDNGGDISFYNSAGSSQDLYWDASTSRLGLGETNPSHELHIKSASPQIRLDDSGGTNTYGDLQYNGVSLNIISRGGASSYGAITFARTDGTNTYNTAQINAAGDFRFYNDSGTAKMRWDASAESLGIGTETPSSVLETSKSDATVWSTSFSGVPSYTPDSHDLTISNTVDNTTGSFASLFFKAGQTSSGSGINTARIAAIREGALSTSLAFSTRSSSGTLDEACRIDSSGRVGIGVAAPSTNLHVYDATSNVVGTFESGDSDVYITLADSATTSDTAMRIGVTGNDLHFSTSATERLRIDSSGEFTLGNPSGGSALQLDVSATGTDGVDIKSAYYSGGYGPMKLHAGGSERIRILSTGGITFNGDTAQANALDDYEEGTFTPAFSASGLSVTYDGQIGNYTKIGRQVYFFLQLGTDAVSGQSASNQLTITGLPFTATTNDMSGSIGLAYSTAVDISGSNFYLSNGQTFLYLYLGVSTTSFSVAQSNVLASGGNSNRIWIQGMYLAA
jgi:hypothetical protein